MKIIKNLENYKQFQISKNLDFIFQNFQISKISDFIFQNVHISKISDFKLFRFQISNISDFRFQNFQISKFSNFKFIFLWIYICHFNSLYLNIIILVNNMNNQYSPFGIPQLELYINEIDSLTTKMFLFLWL